MHGENLKINLLSMFEEHFLIGYEVWCSLSHCFKEITL